MGLSIAVYELLTKEELAKITGLKRDLIDQLFYIGDLFTIGDFVYKIVHATCEEFVCEKWPRQGFSTN